MNMQKTGSFIKENRKRLNLSQQALGEYLSVTDKAVSKWERGLACPDIENLKNMALLFRCSISDIVNGVQHDDSHSSNLPMDLPKEIDVPKSPSEDVTVTLDYTSAQSISSLLFGDNLEHTRGCIYSGLSAEMLRNRKFVSKPGRYGCAHEWYAVGENPIMAFGAPYTRHGDGYKMRRNHERNAQYITNYHAGLTGMGQKDLYLMADTDYDFCAAVRSFSGNQLTVSLIGSDKTVYDSKTLMAESGDYREVAVTLHSPKEDPEARLEITFDSIGTVMIGAISLMPSKNFRGMRVDVIEKIKEVGIKLLRWPGGNFAGEYHWKDGLLPRNMRSPLQSYQWLETQPHSSGYDFHEINTDDFIALCREIGAEPFITLNPTWNTPEESAQWVEYCNGDETTPYGKLRAENGHPEPYNVQFWSLGNEMGYGHMEGANTADAYAKVVREHAEQMLVVSPGLTICSSGPYPNQEWAEYSAQALADVASVVSLHHYAGFPQYIDPEMRREEYEGFIRKVDTEFQPRIRILREQLGDSKVKISYDEWNAWYAWYRCGSVSEGIMTAAFQNMLFRNADKYGVIMACHFESVNEGAIKVYPNGVRLSPTGQVFSVMKAHANGMICALEEDVTSTRKQDVVTTTLLNRSFDLPKTFCLNNTGAVLSAELYSADDVVPGTEFSVSTLAAVSENGTVKIVLPPHSLAVIRTEVA
ncbi:MAG: helix-turn-helix domain-containing protein [Ruminococcaceae bacterium]|nr:helix-turn-helix domain-containing protein [Oscillospiraceae bacterium]